MELKALRDVVQFAYASGYHEHGVDLVGEVEERLIELRNLAGRIVANDHHFVPDLDVDGLAAESLREYEAIVARAKELTA